MSNEEQGPMALLGAVIKESRPAVALKGKKTYLNSAIMVAIGVYVLITGEAPTYANPGGTDPATAIMIIMNGLGLGTLRAGVAKSS